MYDQLRHRRAYLSGYRKLTKNSYTRKPATQQLVIHAVRQSCFYKFILIESEIL
jgi:hypothetical protein